MQNYNKIWARLVSCFLAIAMTFTMMPTTVYAAKEAAGDVSSKLKIVSFDKLDGRLNQLNGLGHAYGLEVELNTSVDELNLPGTLHVTAEETVKVKREKADADESRADPAAAVLDASPADAEEDLTGGENVPAAPQSGRDDEEFVTDIVQKTIGVKWKSNKNYISDKHGEFLFTPVLPKGYSLADDVELPQIYVTVGSDERRMTDKPVVTSTLNFNIKTASEDKLESEGWKWDYNSSGSVLTLNGLDVNVEDGPGIRVPANTKIILKGSQGNFIETSDYSAGIMVTGADQDGYLEISGRGSLNVTGLRNGIDGLQYYGSNKLNVTIKGSWVSAHSGALGPGIDINGNLSIRDGARLRSTTADSGSDGYGIRVAGGTYSMRGTGTEVFAAGEAGGVTSDSSLDFPAGVITGSENLFGKMTVDAVGKERDGDGRSRYIFLGANGEGELAKSIKIVVSNVVGPVVIGTDAPADQKRVEAGVNHAPAGASAPEIYWSVDGGNEWTGAYGDFKENTVYKTKYLYRADEGHVFRGDLESGGVTVKNLGSGTVDILKSSDDKKLTVVVTWPKVEPIAHKRTGGLDFTFESIPKQSDSNESWGDPTQSSIDALSEEKWKWDYHPKGSTLTLDGVNVSVTNDYALRVPENTTIVLTDGSENKLISVSAGNQAALIVNSGVTEGNDGFFKITGSGMLEAAGDGFGVAIYPQGTGFSTVIEKSKLKATASNSRNGKGMLAAESSLAIKEGASVTAVSNGDYEVGLTVDGKLIIEDEGSELLAKGRGGAVYAGDGFHSPGALVFGSVGTGELEKAVFGNGSDSRNIYLGSDGSGSVATTGKLLIAKESDVDTPNSETGGTGAGSGDTGAGTGGPSAGTGGTGAGSGGAETGTGGTGAGSSGTGTGSRGGSDGSGGSSRGSGGSGGSSRGSGGSRGGSGGSGGGSRGSGGSRGGSGGSGGGSRSSGGSGGGSRGAAAPATEPGRSVAGTVNAAAAVNDGKAVIALTGQNISDAVKAAKDTAGGIGVSTVDITAVVHVTTSGVPANAVSISLPKVVQEQIIRDKVSNLVVYVDNPGISVSMNLAAIQEAQTQSNGDIELSAVKVDPASISAEAHRVMGGRPAFDLKASFDHGTKSITSFGSGSIDVAVPYTLQNGEEAGGLYAVYVGGSGEVMSFANSGYDVENKVLRYSANHVSVFGIGYKAPAAFGDTAAHGGR